MSALAKWRPSPDSPIKAGYQCGNPKCGAIRKDANHWFMAFVSNILSFASWDVRDAENPKSAAVFLCGESCMQQLVSIWAAEKSAEAMQGGSK